MKVWLFFCFFFYFSFSVDVFGFLKEKVNGLFDKSKKTKFNDLNHDMTRKVASYLLEKDRNSLALATKEHYQILKEYRQGVVLNFPLKKSKRPSSFLCEQLKTKKNLQIDVTTKKSSDNYYLSDPDSKEMQFLKCLSNIETLLVFDWHFSGFLDHDDFRIQKLFPKLKVFVFQFSQITTLKNVPYNLKVIKIGLDFNYYLPMHAHPEFIKKLKKMKEMERIEIRMGDFFQEKDFSFLVSLLKPLKKLPKLTQMKIVSRGNTEAFNQFLQQHKTLFDYDLEIDFETNLSLNVQNLVENLPLRTKKLILAVHQMENVNGLFNNLKKFTNLQAFTLKYVGNYNFVFDDLPDTIEELEFGSHFNLNQKVTLPKSLKSLKVGKMEATLLDYYANLLETLEVDDLTDIECLKEIEKPFTKLKNFKINNFWDIKIKLADFFNLYNLFPMKMDFVSVHLDFENDSEKEALRKKIIFGGKTFEKLIIQNEMTFIFSLRRMVEI